MPPHGKTASLPTVIRNAVNRLLDENRPETEIAAKVAGMLAKSKIPEVAEITVTQQNVGSRRTGGYEYQNFTKADVERIRRETTEMIQRMWPRPAPVPRNLRVPRAKAVPVANAEPVRCGPLIGQNAAPELHSRYRRRRYGSKFASHGGGFGSPSAVGVRPRVSRERKRLGGFYCPRNRLIRSASPVIIRLS